jgi:WD40 repeat protein
MFRRLIGPRVGRFLTLLLVAGLWAWWLWAPPRPRVEWEIQTSQHHDFWLSPDGRTLIEEPDQTDGRGRRSGPIILRDVATGRERLRLFADDLTAQVRDFAPDGSWLIAHDGEDGLRVLDAADGRELAKFPAEDLGTGRYVWDVAVPPDRHGVVLSSWLKQELHVWDAATRRVRLVVTDASQVAAMSPDGTLLAVVRPPNRWADLSAALFPYLPSSLNALATPATWAAGNCVPVSVSVVDTTTGRELARRSFPRSEYFAPHFTPDGRRLVWVRQNGSPDASVEIWDFQAGTAPATLATLPRAESSNAGFTENRRWIVVRTGDVVRTWDLAQTPPREHRVFSSLELEFPRLAVGMYPGPIGREFGVHPGELLTTTRSFDALEYWHTDDPNRKTVFRLRLRDPSGVPECLFSRDGRRLAVRIGDTQSPVLTWLSDHFGFPEIVPIHSLVQVFDARSGTEQHLFTQTTNGAYCSILGFSSDGEMLWTGVDRELSRTPDPHNAFVVRGWAIHSGGPPIWLVAVTVVGLMLVIADWRRGRRRSVAPLTSM